MKLSEHTEYYQVNDYFRIYFTPSEERGYGFNGEIVEATAYGQGEINWENVVEAHNVGKVHAAFDGVRHLYLGENGEGYIYYPAIEEWIEVLKGLIELEKRYCFDCYE